MSAENIVLNPEQSRRLAEALPAEPRANDPMREAAEQAKSRICAWCHPDIDHPAGHGICQRHRDEMLAQAKELRK